MYSIYAEDFMVCDVKFVYHKMSYEELKQLLLDNKDIYRFPLVDNTNSRILLGSIQRLQLVVLIERQVGSERRHFEAMKRMRDVHEKAKQATLKLENEKPVETTKVLIVRSPSNVSIGKVNYVEGFVRKFNRKILETGKVFTDVHQQIREKRCYQSVFVNKFRHFALLHYNKWG